VALKCGLTAAKIANYVTPKRDKKTNETRNQYASPPDGNAMPAGRLSDSDENLFFFHRFLSLSVRFSEFLTLSL